MTGESVGDGVQQYRPFALRQDLFFAGNRIDDSEWIITVYALGMHLLRVQARPKAREDAKAAGLPDRLTAHPVEVVHEVDNQGETAAMRFVEQGFELLHGREAERFPGGTAGGRGIADIGDHDSGLAVDALEQGCADADVRGAADYRVVGIDAKRSEEGVHGPPPIPLLKPASRPKISARVP